MGCDYPMLVLKHIPVAHTLRRSYVSTKNKLLNPLGQEGCEYIE